VIILRYQKQTFDPCGPIIILVPTSPSKLLITFYGREKLRFVLDLTPQKLRTKEQLLAPTFANFSVSFSSKVYNFFLSYPEQMSHADSLPKIVPHVMSLGGSE